MAAKNQAQQNAWDHAQRLETRAVKHRRTALSTSTERQRKLQNEAARLVAMATELRRKYGSPTQ